MYASWQLFHETPKRLSNIYLCNHEIESINVIYILMERYNHNEMLQECGEMSIINWCFTLWQRTARDGSVTTCNSHLPWNGREFEFVVGMGVASARPPGSQGRTWTFGKWDVPSPNGALMWALALPQQKGKRIGMCVWQGAEVRMVGGGSRASLPREGAPYVGSKSETSPRSTTIWERGQYARSSMRERMKQKIDGFKNWQSEGVRREEEEEFMGGKMDW